MCAISYFGHADLDDEGTTTMEHRGGQESPENNLRGSRRDRSHHAPLL
jgi:hypothetical protein